MQFVVEFRSMNTLSAWSFNAAETSWIRKARNVLNFKVCDNLCARDLFVPQTLHAELCRYLWSSMKFWLTIWTSQKGSLNTPVWGNQRKLIEFWAASLSSSEWQRVWHSLEPWQTFRKTKGLLEVWASKLAGEKRKSSIQLINCIYPAEKHKYFNFNLHFLLAARFSQIADPLVLQSLKPSSLSRWPKTAQWQFDL